MPELPDIVVYCESLTRHYANRVVERVDLKSPFVVRTADPDLFAVEGRRLLAFQRLGKRIVWQVEEDLYLVLHLMIAGRLHRRKAGARPRSKADLAAFQFDDDTLMLTEASPKKRASIHLINGSAGLAVHDPGGLDVLACDADAFEKRLRVENHTLKRALTDPRFFDGIGNAYSDEILHAARLSPIQWTSRLSDAEVVRLHVATQRTLRYWIDLLRTQTADAFPEKVTAFRPEMAVHGKFRQPCPECGTTVQRIRYADRETNYCPACQTGGKLLADRSLSRLLKDDWPKTLE